MKTNDNHQRNLRAAMFSIGTALFLMILKTITAILSGSISLLASALDSFLDSAISVINYFTIKAASKPPDKEHRFGHGKFEAFAELAQSIFVAASGIVLAIESIRRFFRPQEVEHETAGIIVMAVSISVTFLLSRHLKKVSQETGSVVVKADLAHFGSDLLANLSVIAGLLAVSLTGIDVFDPIISLGISIFILKTAWELLQESYHILTDHELPLQTRVAIMRILNSAPKPVAGWHLLRTRRVGTQIHIDYHLVLGDEVTLRVAHDASEQIENRIRKQFPTAVILAHFDPDDDSKENWEILTKQS